MKLPRLVALPLIFALSVPAAQAAAVGFGEQLDSLHPYLSDSTVQTILERAESIAAGPISVRSYSLEDMEGREGARMGDARAKAAAVMRNGVKWDIPAEDLPRWAETFALASSDTGTARLMLEELPLLAAAIRLTGSETCKDYLVRQLQEIVTWKPFQRPGWTVASRVDAFPEEGDGVWLSTGALIQGLAIMEEILPEGALPEDLDVAIRQRVAEEIEMSYDDWLAERTWYVRAEAINSNQWVVPASGMVIGAAMLGPEQYPDIYALGVDCLRRSMTVVGEDGSMSEGYTYAMTWTSVSFFLAAHFMEMAGDSGLGEQPFFKNFPDYLSLYFQPGGNVVNASDVFGGQRNHPEGARLEVTRLAGLSANVGLVRVLMGELGRPQYDFFGLLVMGIHLNEPDAPWPPAWGLFQRTRLFIWRSGWEDNASGAWVRGGDPEDFHDNHDRGNVNFIVGGTPVVIESGTPGYALPAKKTDFDSGLGHNVLRLGEDNFPLKAEAPITVAYADTEGGEVSVDLAKVYPKLAAYTRTVAWTLDEMTVNDELTVPEGSPVEPRLTWHLASQETPVIERPDPRRAVVHVPAGQIDYPAWIGSWGNHDGVQPEGEDIFKSLAITVEIEADQPFELSAGQRPDHTLKYRKFTNPHTSLELSFPAGVPALSMTTVISAKAPAKACCAAATETAPEGASASPVKPAAE